MTALFRRRPRAGTIVMIEEITRSDRPRLEKYRPPPPIWPLLAACLAWAALVAAIAAVARWLA